MPGGQFMKKKKPSETFTSAGGLPCFVVRVAFWVNIVQILILFGAGKTKTIGKFNETIFASKIFSLRIKIDENQLPFRTGRRCVYVT